MAALPADFLSGESGTVGGWDGARRRLLDRLELPLRAATGRWIDRRAEALPRFAVLLAGAWRPERAGRSAALRRRLERSRHRLEWAIDRPRGEPRLVVLNRLLGAAAPLGRFDWVVVVDDDVVVPNRFLDRFLAVCWWLGFDLAQPAHLRASHAAWRLTRRQPFALARRTAFVEIGPLVAFAPRAAAELLPPPPLGMGWGLDAHWAAVARERGWRVGVVDAVPILHPDPAASSYGHEQAIAEAIELLRDRPYLPKAESQRTLERYPLRQAGALAGRGLAG